MEFQNDTFTSLTAFLREEVTEGGSRHALRMF